MLVLASALAMDVIEIILKTQLQWIMIKYGNSSQLINFLTVHKHLTINIRRSLSTLNLLNKHLRYIVPTNIVPISLALKIRLET